MSPAGDRLVLDFAKEAFVNEQLGADEVTDYLSVSFSHPYLYFSADMKNNPKIDQQVLETAVVEELMKFPGASLAVSGTPLRKENVADTPLMRALKHNFHPKRSGNVFLVLEPTVH